MSRSASRPTASLPPAGPPAAKPSRAQRTRERILKTSLDLFNTYGEAHVTTGHIADELNISPGNLYYHFRNKEEIIQHLFREFEQQIDVAPHLEKQAEEGIADIGAAMEDLWLYLHLVFEAIWTFRFLYRNLDDLLARDAKLKSHFNRIVEHKRKSVVTLCKGLIAAGAMKAEPEQIKALAENILVVATYWLNFQHIAQRQVFRADLGETEDLGRGVFQVMALVGPYLVGPAREHLDHLSKNYID
ncbi:MAG: TetR/AcrR family transcriptional regulator [Burkholderiales bacterium]|nr:TetR/AcrR family transcriptional regulator [Burkholderiales bacterium]